MTYLLNHFIEKYKQIRLATIEDNKDILNFFKSVKMKTSGMNLSYDCSPDFFSFLNKHYQYNFVFLLLNKDSSIQGIAVISLREAMIAGKQEYAGYLSDLRIGPKLDKRVRVYWRKLYEEVLQYSCEILEFKKCKYFYSVILSTNLQALQSLTNKKMEIEYRRMHEFTTLSILARIPHVFNVAFIDDIMSKLTRAKTRAKTLKYQVNIKKNISNKDYQLIKSSQKDKMFGYVMHNREAHLIEVSVDGKVVASALLNKTLNDKKLVVSNINFANKVLGYARRLFGLQSIESGEALKFLYLSQISFESSVLEKSHDYIIKLMIDYLFNIKIAKKYHAICLLDEFNFFKKYKLHYLTHKTKSMFFQVYSKKKSDEIDIQNDCNHNISFDIYSS